MDFIVLPGASAKITAEFMQRQLAGAKLQGIGRSGQDNRELVFAFDDGHAIHLEADQNGIIQHKKTGVNVRLVPLAAVGAEGRF